MVNNDNNPGDMELGSMMADYGSLDHEDMEFELESMMDYNGVFDKQKYNELESMMTRAEDAIKKWTSYTKKTITISITILMIYI